MEKLNNFLGNAKQNLTRGKSAINQRVDDKLSSIDQSGLKQDYAYSNELNYRNATINSDTFTTGVFQFDTTIDAYNKQPVLNDNWRSVDLDALEIWVIDTPESQFEWLFPFD